MFSPIKIVYVDSQPVFRFFIGWTKNFIHLRFPAPAHLVMAMEEVLGSKEVVERYFEQKNGLGFFVRDGKKIRLYIRHDDKILNISVSPKELSKILKEIKKAHS